MAIQEIQVATQEATQGATRGAIQEAFQGAIQGAVQIDGIWLAAGRHCIVAPLW